MLLERSSKVCIQTHALHTVDSAGIEEVQRCLIWPVCIVFSKNLKREKKPNVSHGYCIKLNLSLFTWFALPLSLPKLYHRDVQLSSEVKIAELKTKSVAGSGKQNMHTLNHQLSNNYLDEEIRVCVFLVLCTVHSGHCRKYWTRNENEWISRKKSTMFLAENKTNAVHTHTYCCKFDRRTHSNICEAMKTKTQWVNNLALALVILNCPQSHAQKMKLPFSDCSISVGAGSVTFSDVFKRMLRLNFSN